MMRRKGVFGRVVGHLFGAAALSLTVTAHAPAQAADQSTPEAVLETLVAVAQNGAYEELRHLCDPLGENDGDTQSICALADAPEQRPLFAEFFREAAATDPAQISDDGALAALPFVFGPNGDDPEELMLVRRDGLWYLLSF